MISNFLQMAKVENNFKFKATPQFWKSFNALPPQQQEEAKKTFQIFQKNPSDPSLRVHKINRLSALRKNVVRSIVVGDNLRAVFEVKGNVITSLDIGTHDIYK